MSRWNNNKKLSRRSKIFLRITSKYIKLQLAVELFVKTNYKKIIMIIIFILIFSFINFLYVRIWNKFSNKVPSGVGVLLTIPCFFLYLEQNLYFINILLILVFSFLYFFDDLIEINFLFRIVLQIFASLVVYFSFFIELNFIVLFLNLLAFFVLVNTLNFNDGEDLNIAILLIIVFSIFYLYSESKFIQNTSEIILYFLISFSFFNMKKNFLYFGDSGCYFISIIIFLFIYQEITNDVLIKLLTAVIAFPIIDVFYVVIYRLFKKQNLVSRNYLHLYQVVSKKTKSKFYLLINILFSAINIFVASYFSLGINFIIFLVIVNIVLLLAIRSFIEKFLGNNEN